MKNNYLIFLLLGFNLISCQAQENSLETQLESCVLEYFNDDEARFNEKVDSLEDYLIDQGVLSSNSATSYYEAFMNLPDLNNEFNLDFETYSIIEQSAYKEMNCFTLLFEDSAQKNKKEPIVEFSMNFVTEFERFIQMGKTDIEAEKLAYKEAAKKGGKKIFKSRMMKISAAETLLGIGSEAIQ